MMIVANVWMDARFVTATINAGGNDVYIYVVKVELYSYRSI